jgi:hypothetical protein
MKTPIQKFVAFCLVLMILLASPPFLLAQNKLVGELVITKNSPEGFVSVNGERAISGRSVTSTSEIITSSRASAKILLPQTGTVLISPNSNLNLSFINSSISGDLVSGEVTIETVPNTSLNLLTPDGNITTPNQNQANIIKVTVVNKRTRIQTLTGAVNFNNVLVSAGEFYPLADNEKTRSSKSGAADAGNSKGFNPLLIIGILGAVAGAAVIALSVSSNNSETSTVSPTR